VFACGLTARRAWGFVDEEIKSAFLTNQKAPLREPFTGSSSLLMDFTTLTGLVAAFCTTVSYYPQLKKCWETGSAGDLSLKMFLTMAAGVAPMGGLSLLEKRRRDYCR
jgi:hypothetical protein